LVLTVAGLDLSQQRSVLECSLNNIFGTRVAKSFFFRNKTQAIQFDANGDVLTQVIFGDGVFDKTRFIGSWFSYDPFLDRMVMLMPKGEFLHIYHQ